MSRAREMAVRLARGASRGRLIRQLLIESLTLSIVSTALGLIFSLWIASLVSQIALPAPVPYDVAIAMNARLLIYASLLEALATVCCGFAPALRGTRADLLPSLKQELPHAQFLNRRFTPRNLLVIGQVAISVVLLVTALLFVQSLRRIRTIEPGFDASHTLRARLVFSSELDNASRLRAVESAAIERLESAPGIASASCAAFAPLSFSGAFASLATPRATSSMNSVCPRYFETMGIGMIRGREFSDADRAGAPPVAIVNETLARQLFADRDALGQSSVQETEDERGQRTTIDAQIVGIVRDSRYNFLGEAPAPFLYRPFAQPPAVRRQAVLLARSTGLPVTAQRAVMAAIAEVEPSIAVDIAPMQDAVSFVTLPSRVIGVFFTGLGALGLLLACIGLHGTMAFAVGRRTMEIGIRMALGATRGGVMRMVMTDSLALIGIGLVIGAALAWLIMRPLAMLLAHGVNSADPATFIIVASLLLAAGLLAGLPPARRAVRVDPNRALRYE